MIEINPERIMRSREEKGVNDEYHTLFLRTHDTIQRAHHNRIITNNKPTVAEYSLGAFTEDIPPFMKDAVFAIHKKGYVLNEWGITGYGKEIQFLSGEFVIKDPKAKTELTEMKVRLDVSSFEGVTNTEIYFKPKEANTNKIKATWDRIADIMPDTGRGAQKRRSPTATSFRSTYGQDKKSSIELSDTRF